MSDEKLGKRYIAVLRMEIDRPEGEQWLVDPDLYVEKRDADLAAQRYRGPSTAHEATIEVDIDDLLPSSSVAHHKRLAEQHAAKVAELAPPQESYEWHDRVMCAAAEVVERLKPQVGIDPQPAKRDEIAELRALAAAVERWSGGECACDGPMSRSHNRKRGCRVHSNRGEADADLRAAVDAYRKRGAK